MSRKFVIHTGERGYEAINDSMLLSVFDMMREFNDVDDAFYNSTFKMLKSSDSRDRFLARRLIENKLKELNNVN